MTRTNVGLFVGLNVGFLMLPDMDQPCGVNSFSPDCRVCRVYTGVEPSGDCEILQFGAFQRRRSLQQIHCIGLE
jgi:hypothetical protein